MRSIATILRCYVTKNQKTGTNFWSTWLRPSELRSTTILGTQPTIL